MFNGITDVERTELIAMCGEERKKLEFPSLSAGQVIRFVTKAKGNKRNTHTHLFELENPANGSGYLILDADQSDALKNGHEILTFIGGKRIDVGWCIPYRSSQNGPVKYLKHPVREIVLLDTVHKDPS